MSQSIMEARLLYALEAEATAAGKVYGSSATPTGGVEVRRRSTLLGLWRWTGSAFMFTARGQANPVVEFDTVAEAAHFTRQHLYKT